MILKRLSNILKTHGLMVRGGYHPGTNDTVPDGTRTLILIGNAGPDMWQAFADHIPDAPNPMDTWTKGVIDKIALEFDARAAYPFQGPPYYPFQQWAMKSDTVFETPIGPLIHPAYGMWHAYRGALLFEEHIDLPALPDTPSPCETCADKPCLKTCPVGAFSAHGYDVPKCRSYIGSSEGADCLGNGCLARRACPVGQDYIYEPAQAVFHMTHFLQSK